MKVHYLLASLLVSLMAFHADAAPLSKKPPHEGALGGPKQRVSHAAGGKNFVKTPHAIGR